MPNRLTDKLLTVLLVLLLGFTVFMMDAAFRPTLVVHAGGGVAVTRTLTATTDAELDEKNPAVNAGSGTSMRVRAQTNGNPQRFRSLARFTIRAADGGIIPNSSAVSSSTLTLTSSSFTAGRTEGAHRLTTAWSEGTVTWASPWTSAGGDFNATATGTASTATTMNFTVTGDVSAFVNGTQTNNGWLVKDASEGTNTGDTTTFSTREAAANKPTLSVTYTAPWDSYNSGCASVTDTFDANTNIVCAKGSGFQTTTGLYDVGYYDGGGTLRCVENGLTATGGTLQSADCALNNPTYAVGTWHVVAFRDAAGSASPPLTYASIDQQTNDVIADDTFTVQASALPEIPSSLAALGAIGLSMAAYLWLRRRRRQGAYRG